MTKTIEAEYRIVTPLFGAGADSNNAELRLPSFKGVLRFWWRALAWQRCVGELGRIKAEEDALFGSTGTGQSRVIMRLVPSRLPNQVPRSKRLTMPGTDAIVGDGARYLGYGVMEAFESRNRGTKAGELTRSCLPAPIDFTVLIRTRELSDEQMKSLEDALIAMGILGGMGAKSRKGYGSTVLRSLRIDGAETWSTPRSDAEVKRVIAELHRAGIADALPSFTALSSRSRYVLLRRETKEPLDLLDAVGRELVRFRSWGRQGKILGGNVNSEHLFKDDHDLMKADPSQRRTHPRRIAFGLPHNYGSGREMKVGPFDRALDRRASPLFIHVHEFDEAVLAIVSFLPALFLPRDRSEVSVGGAKIALAPADRLYDPVHQFLDRLLDSEKRKEKFESAMEVRP